MILHTTVELSIVIPLYNEAEGIPTLFKELNRVLSELPKQTEVIFVDDGSTDKTLQLLSKSKLIRKKKVISFSRNFGHQAAIFAGLENARGKYIITMDGDLQHPPELLPQLYALNKKDYDIVLTNRVERNAFSFKSISSKLFYDLINLVSSTLIPTNSSDFRSMSRPALNALLALPEKRKFLRGLVSWIGFTSTTISYTVDARKFGTSKYNFKKMLRLALSGVTSFTALPLYLAGIVSFFLFLAAFLYGLYVVHIRFVLSQVVPGWTSVILVVLIIGGLTSLFLGLIGVYLAAIYEELKSRPIYIQKDTSASNK